MTRRFLLAGFTHALLNATTSIAMFFFSYTIYAAQQGAPPPIDVSNIEIQHVLPSKVRPGDEFTVFFKEMTEEQAADLAKGTPVLVYMGPNKLDGKLTQYSKTEVWVDAHAPETADSGPYIVTLKIGDHSFTSSDLLVVEPWWSDLAGRPISWLVFSAILVIAFWTWRFLRERREVRKVIRQEPLPDGTLPVAAPPQTPVEEFPQPPEQLEREIRSGECVVVLGPGMRADAGLATWASLLEKIAVESSEPLDVKQCLYLLRVDRVDDVVDYLNAKLPSGKLAKKIAEILTTQTIADSVAQSTLSVIPFAGAVSVNVDTIENAIWENTALTSVYTHDQAEQCLDALSREQFFVLKINGTIESPETMLLSHQQLLDALSRNAALRDLLRRLYYTRTLLFLGFTVPNLQSFLRLIDRSADPSRHHVALVPSDDLAFDALISNIQRQFGVDAVRYPVAESNPISTYLSGITTAITGSFAQGPLLSKLTHIELKNIGPFTQCELDIDHRWTILLGDNGVGKSTVLRAVAVALCGTAPESFAGRLLRSGAPSGSITLFIGNRKYVTTISRKSGGGYSIESPSGVPIELEGILCMGFSALRSISAFRSDGAGPLPGRPVAADLAPLTADQPDTRIDNVKNWIGRLDHLRRSDTISVDERVRYEQLFNRVFEVFAEIAAGVKITPIGINPQTGEILIHSADGEISFESLSQGTLSLVSWTGTLLQRMFETAPANVDPMKTPAIVLVDEIDAHMHPAWQQTLINRLSGMFENVQFLATSHSPLLVSGLEPSQVYRFQRSDSGTVFTEQLVVPLKGQGAAGLLTSELFGLASQLDTETAEALDRKRQLTAKQLKGTITGSEEEELRDVAQKVATVDFSTHVRDPLFAKFVAAMSIVQSEERERKEPPLKISRDERDKTTQLATDIAREIRLDSTSSEDSKPV